MTEESSSTSHLSVAMTTIDVTQVSDENTMTSSSASLSLSRGIQFYSRIALLVIGLVGTVTNGLILYALVASKQHKKHVLIVNQNALDFFTSVMMVIVYSMKLSNLYLTGSLGYWLCILLLSESILWTGTLGSVINLASITIERYLKVVHHAWSKTKLKNWMIYSAMAFTWIGTFAWIMAFVFSTTEVKDGACYPYTIWVSDNAQIINDLWYFLSFYVIILLIFIFCYWRILVVIRRQAKVTVNSDVEGTIETQTRKMQSSVVKTMILVCALYAILWLPSHINVLMLDYNPNYPPTASITYATSLTAYLYMCTNPLVYATKFDPVRKVLLRLIPCKKNSE